MTKNEIFKKVFDHMMNQGEQSKFEGGACAYKAHDGKSCAVGCLITEEYYDPDFEFQTVLEDPRIFEAVAKSLGVEELSISEKRMLYGLQEIHDSNEPEEWYTELSKLEKSIFF